MINFAECSQAELNTKQTNTLTSGRWLKTELKTNKKCQKCRRRIKIMITVTAVIQLEIIVKTSSPSGLSELNSIRPHDLS